ncbi:hypothetical protein LRS73_18025 [Methylobacterium currus]|uniref:hypothetical protein n=1 Tax=Methylobacterium currus TaxID=2051553 RepID=UPI001E2CBDE4|nr:hypothetical protein [Methylobacterium currus]UHC14446.1 hypothetical protein LRS73_18025 [Methylobacterium currus]
MDASTTLLALGWGRGAHTPNLPTAAAGPAIPQASDDPNRWASFYRCDLATQAYLAGLGYGPPAGHQPAPDRVPQGAAVDWDSVVAAQNARAGLRPGANLRGQGHQRAAAPMAPAPTQASANLWDDVIREQNAKLPPNAVIPGQRGGR